MKSQLCKIYLLSIANNTLLSPQNQELNPYIDMVALSLAVHTYYVRDINREEIEV